MDYVSRKRVSVRMVSELALLDAGSRCRKVRETSTMELPCHIQFTHHNYPIGRPQKLIARISFKKGREVEMTTSNTLPNSFKCDSHW